MNTCRKCKKEKPHISFPRHSRKLCLKCHAMKMYYLSKNWSERKCLGLEAIKEKDKIKVVTKYSHPIIYLNHNQIMELSKRVDLIVIGENEVYLKWFYNREKEDILTRMNVLERDGYECCYCGAEGKTMDHITPMSKGGEFVRDNLATACDRCNFVKDDVDISIELMKSLVLENNHLSKSSLKRLIKQHDKCLEANNQELVQL